MTEPDAPTVPTVPEVHELPELPELPEPPSVSRGAAVTVLALLASLYAMHWASALVVPVLLGLMLSYSLSPLVDQLQRWHVPRALAAALLLAGIAAGFGATAYSLSDDAVALVESLPEAADKVRESLRAARGAPESVIQKVQRAATRIEEVSEERSLAAAAVSKGVLRVQVERSRFSVKDHLWSGTLGLAGLAAQAITVAFISYFLMAAGDRFRRKVLSIAGPRFASRRITLQVLDDITRQIQNYLLVQIATSVLVGMATALVFWALGLDHVLVWGIAAAVLNLVPYFGSVVLAAGASLTAFLQFGTHEMALWVALASLVVHTLAGNLLVPWLTARASRMSPLVIFVGVLAWGWLLGIWGLLLGAPLLMVAKAVCDRVDPFRPIGELLGD